MSSAGEILMTVSMTVVRGTVAHAVVDASGVTAGDRVVDVGCGPGTAARLAVRRGAVVTGVDPVPLALRLARAFDTLGRARGALAPGRGALGPARGARWLAGHAEALPLPDGEATLVWAISSLHHWEDVPAGLAEVRRVLRPGGRVVLAERLVERPHAHALTSRQIDEVSRQVADAGFADVRTETRRAGRRTMALVRGTS